MAATEPAEAGRSSVELGWMQHRMSKSPALEISKQHLKIHEQKMKKKVPNAGDADSAPSHKQEHYLQHCWWRLKRGNIDARVAFS